MNTRITFPARLCREWQALASRPSVLRRAAGWGLGVPFESLDDVVKAAGLADRGRREAVPSTATSDLVMRRLVRAAHTDEVAARVVLQRLLPGLCNRAHRWADRYDGDWLAAFDDLVAAAWLAINAYAPERRPTHLAAGLLRDAEHLAFVKETRRCWRAESVEPHHLDLPVEPVGEDEPLLELVDALQVAGSALTADDRLLMTMLAGGATTTEVAATMNVSVRTLANRREAAVHRVRAALAA